MDIIPLRPSEVAGLTITAKLPRRCFWRRVGCMPFVRRRLLGVQIRRPSTQGSLYQEGIVDY
jgi:hypothetical protein